MFEKNEHLRKVADEFSIDALNVSEKIDRILGKTKEEKKK